ncbi:sugar phosphate isomerase/epimerase [Xenophilus arseniciresistens]|uniref:Sugar phosphate isomerase/epimerase n=1 Tax=Xenophilus arseniciresistens TaxID=1283306 RepID=A0AAE3SZP0_9BURK|nr:sugar phosphate isomerase/epimerase family protein [Xenophilus arseniciresistens]MDA7416076.1 sugar phosphate isomerase/epimerase [Xenophilus arseniciresistens]
MKIGLCNEVLASLPLERQCETAAALGYDGLEIAPFTLSDAPERIGSAQAARIRATVESFGLVVTGLHWLLVKPEGLSLTSPDPALRERTVQVMERLVGLCAELGGAVLVHGSPRQRAIAEGDSHATALARLQEGLARAARAAAREGVIYCIEPLSPRETPVINTLAEGAQIVRAVNEPALKTMLDCSAAGLSEAQDVPALIDQWLPTDLIGHVQLNDPNRRGPGQGAMRFAPILSALHRHGYAGAIGVEPFDYLPDGPGCAAFAAGYLRGLREALGC